MRRVGRSRRATCAGSTGPDAPEVPWSDFVRLPLAREDSELKRAALDAYASQQEGVDGEEPIIHAGMKAHFLRSWETFVVPL